MKTLSILQGRCRFSRRTQCLHGKECWVVVGHVTGGWGGTGWRWCIGGWGRAWVGWAEQCWVCKDGGKIAQNTALAFTVLCIRTCYHTRTHTHAHTHTHTRTQSHKHAYNTCDSFSYELYVLISSYIRTFSPTVQTQIHSPPSQSRLWLALLLLLLQLAHEFGPAAKH